MSQIQKERGALKRVFILRIRVNLFQKKRELFIPNLYSCYSGERKRGGGETFFKINFQKKL
jgi:hypothetical protein